MSSDEYEGLREARRRKRRRNRNAMRKAVEKSGVLERVEFINEGTCLLDGKFYYYAQKKTARRKGDSKYYQMRSFEHFIEVFGKR